MPQHFQSIWFTNVPHRKQATKDLQYIQQVENFLSELYNSMLSMIKQIKGFAFFSLPSMY